MQFLFLPEGEAGDGFAFEGFDIETGVFSDAPAEVGTFTTTHVGRFPVVPCCAMDPAALLEGR